MHESLRNRNIAEGSIITLSVKKVKKANNKKTSKYRTQANRADVTLKERMEHRLAQANDPTPAPLKPRAALRSMQGVAKFKKQLEKSQARKLTMAGSSQPNQSKPDTPASSVTSNIEARAINNAISPSKQDLSTLSVSVSTDVRNPPNDQSESKSKHAVVPALSKTKLSAPETPSSTVAILSPENKSVKVNASEKIKEPPMEEVQKSDTHEKIQSVTILSDTSLKSKASSKYIEIENPSDMESNDNRQKNLEAPHESEFSISNVVEEVEILSTIDAKITNKDVGDKLEANVSTPTLSNSISVSKPKISASLPVKLLASTDIAKGDEDDAYRKRIENKLKGAGTSGPTSSVSASVPTEAVGSASLAMKPSATSSNDSDDAYRQRIQNKLKGAGVSGPSGPNSKTAITELDPISTDDSKSSTDNIANGKDSYHTRIENKLKGAGVSGPSIKTSVKVESIDLSSKLKSSSDIDKDAMYKDKLENQLKLSVVIGPSLISSDSVVNKSSSKLPNVRPASSSEKLITSKYDNEYNVENKVRKEGSSLVSNDDPLNKDKENYGFASSSFNDESLKKETLKNSILSGHSVDDDFKHKSFASNHSDVRTDSLKKSKDVGEVMVADVHFDTSKMLPIEAQIYDDDDDVIIGGLIVDEDQENFEIAESKKLATNRLICITVIIIIASIAIFVPISTTVFERNRDLLQPSLAPSSVPSLIPSSMPSSNRFSQFTQVIVKAKVTDIEELLDQSSPQYAALNWIADEDDVDVNAVNVIQRYVLAVFYFAMSGDRWYICPRGTDCLCRFESYACMTIEDHHVDQLSKGPECDWYRLKCDEDGWVTHMLYGKIIL